MKRLLVPALLLNALLLGLRAWQELPPARAAAVASENGDTNGDGERDLADAVHLLTWLFSGGPEPVALAQEPEITAEQREILGYLSLVDLPVDRDGGTARALRLTGVNLQVVNGMESTGTTNRVGNILVGYLETHTPVARSGSHNVVVGARHNFTSFGGIVGGFQNTISGIWSCALGGTGNEASGNHSSILGGYDNHAEGSESSVSGGAGNRAIGDLSSLSGGCSNAVEGQCDWRAGDLFQDQ